MSNSTLFLCFYGDGPYWKDLLYVPAYPAGYSYPKWAFRYETSRWLSRDLQNEVRSQEHQRIEVEGILGVRFGRSEQNRLLPLRRLTITWIDLTAGITQFYFRLGPLLDFTQFNTLEGAWLELPADEVAADGPVANALAFRSKVDVSALKWSAEKDEDDAWYKLLDLVRSNERVPLRGEVKSATYVRFSNVTRVKAGRTAAVVAPTQLEVSTGRGPIYGAKLTEGSDYEIKLTHRVLAEGSGATATAPNLPLELKLPASNSIQLSQPPGEFLGWYQTTPINFKALIADKAYQDLIIRAEKKKADASGGGAQAQDADAEVALPIPLKVGVGWLYRLRTRWALQAGLALVLAAQSAVVYLQDFLDKLTDGKATFSDLAAYWLIFLVLFVLGAIASVLVTQLSGRASPKG